MRASAMLQEMGVTVWTRAETAAPRPQPPCRPLRWPCPPPRPYRRTCHRPPPAMPVAQPSPAPAARAPAAPAPAAPAALQGWAHQAQPLRCACTHLSCCTHGGSGTDAARVGRWLAHRDRRHCGRRPSGGDADKLLDNMLRANRCTATPRVRGGAGTPRTRRPHG